MALIQKAFSDIITFSRSSNATRIGPNGLVQYAPHNLQVRSQEFENAIWTKSGASITANATAAPDGTVTSDKLVEDSSSGNHQTYQLGLTVVAQSYTASVYAKAAERTNIWLALFNGTTNGGVYFNLANGTAGSLGTDVTAASITPAGNGWYRCSITRTMVASANAGINIQLADSTPSIGYVGNGSSGVFIWGAQLAVGPLALDYTPTTSAAVYGPRFDYDPVTLAARGLLVEEARTNLLTYSEDYSNAAWTKTNSTVTANSATSPDGTVTADLISGTGAGQVITQTVTANGTQQTLSFFVKKPSSGVFSGATLLFYNLTTTSVIGLAKFSGETFTVNATTGTGTSTAYGNGWYRITLTNSSGLSSGNLLICYLYPDNLQGASSANDTVLAWGAQCE